MKKKLFAALFSIVATVQLLAQATAETPDFMRSIGKMYVVYGVLLLTFVGIILFLVRLERNINRLEKG